MYKSIIIIVFSMLMFITACTNKPSITDEVTKYDLPLVDEVENTHVVHTLYYDGMFRGVEQYRAGGQLVVDPYYYDSHEISRGDVVYLELTEEERSTGRKEYDVLRIIGLPGEKVSVDKGQVYINDHMLDTFYGKEYYNGEFINGSDEGYTMSTVMIPNEHYIVATDTWWRDGIYIEPITKEKIKGKVIGWSKKK